MSTSSISNLLILSLITGSSGIAQYAVHPDSNMIIDVHSDSTPVYQKGMRQPDTTQAGYGTTDWGAATRQGADTAIRINDAQSRSRLSGQQSINLQLQNQLLLQELIARKKMQEELLPETINNAEIVYRSNPQLLARAKSGDIQAQYTLAKELESAGASEQALTWFISAAAEGHAISQMAVGKYFLEGWHRNQSFEQALYWYSKAAELGNPDAQLSVGTFYYLGWGCDQDKSKAMGWISEAAVQGQVNAQELMGRSYFNGEGVDKDLRLAEMWFRQAAVKGNVNAQKGLADTLSVEKEDSAEAFKWYMEAARQGHTEAMLNVALQYYAGEAVQKDTNAGLEWHRKAASSGNLDAQSILAQMLATGHVLTVDKQEALKWGEIAAYRGDTQCMTLLATEKMKGSEICDAYAWINTACFINPTDEGMGLKQTILKQLSQDQMIVAREQSSRLIIVMIDKGIL